MQSTRLRVFAIDRVRLLHRSHILCTIQKYSSGSIIRSISYEEVEKNQEKRSDKLLYKESQQLTIRMMLGVSVVNAVFWSNQLVQYALYNNIVIQGINLGGDPTWAYFGSFATAAIIYFSRTYAHHSVYQCYESQDGKRIGFQVHTLWGYPGRKFEVGIGNARFLSKSNPIMVNVYGIEDNNSSSSNKGVVSHLLKTTMIPIAVDGFKGNLLLDEHGLYSNKQRLAELLSVDKGKEVDSKQIRKQWSQQVKGRKHIKQ